LGKVDHVADSDYVFRTSDLVLSPSADPAWVLVEEGVDLAREREVESLFAIGNGYLGMRASNAEDGQYSHASTFVAGIYVADKNTGPRLAVLPHWFHVELTVENHRLSLESGNVLAHRRRLDLRQGALWREWRHQDPSGRITRVTYLELASLADRHVLLQSVAITPENYAGSIDCTTRLGPSDVIHTDMEQVVSDAGAMLLRVSGKEIGIAATSKVQSLAPSALLRAETRTEGKAEQWSWKVALGETIRLDRIFAVFTSRDVASPADAARDHLASVRARGFATAAADHVEAWRRRWEAADIQIAGDEEAQRALRFAIYHLVAAANPADERVSIAARGLTGEAYRGHVFWDTEIYMLPFYVFTDPPAARALLMYRYNTLDGARRKAKAHGCEGALYAWESADTGEEVTPQIAIAPDGRVINILTGQQEHHISADVAYAVRHYWRATGDDAFMAAAGIEMLVETARFWASRAMVERDGSAHIRHVIGPDEYHEAVDDNAYTNAMAAFNLEGASEAVAILKQSHPTDGERLSVRLGLKDSECQRWRTLATAIVTGADPATKLFEQFAGYFGLEEADVVAQRDHTMSIEAYLGVERIRRSQIIKQADVVALSALLWGKWPAPVHAANFRYYEPRTVHGSSLSPGLHALVAARLGDLALAQAYFRQAAEIDLANNMGNAAGGVHMGALGSLWQATVFGIAGVALGENAIGVDPHLLPGWTELAFPLQWRGRLLRLRLQADPRRVEVAVEKGDELTIAVPDGPACRARGGQRFVLQGDPSGWTNWEEVGR
jgi:trehalose/maltose hydrolase-like predicted phosphorylase